MTMRRYPSQIVGLPYPNRTGSPCHQAAELLTVGETVRLEREPTNAHDNEAIAVLRFNVHVGYVPARHTSWIGEQLDSGRGLTATVGDIHRDAADRIVNVDLDIDLTR